MDEVLFGVKKAEEGTRVTGLIRIKEFGSLIPSENVDIQVDRPRASEPSHTTVESPIPAKPSPETLETQHSEEKKASATPTVSVEEYRALEARFAEQADTHDRIMRQNLELLAEVESMQRELVNLRAERSLLAAQLSQK